MTLSTLSYKAALGNDTSKWLSLAKEAGIFAAIAALTTLVGALETETAFWAPTAVAILGLLVSYLRKLVGTSTVPTAVMASPEVRKERLRNQILNDLRRFQVEIDDKLKAQHNAILHTLCELSAGTNKEIRSLSQPVVQRPLIAVPEELKAQWTKTMLDTRHGTPIMECPRVEWVGNLPKRGVLVNLPDMKTEPPEERALKGGGLSHEEWLANEVCPCGQPATELHKADGDYVPMCQQCHTEAHNTPKENQ